MSDCNIEDCFHLAKSLAFEAGKLRADLVVCPETAWAYPYDAVEPNTPTEKLDFALRNDPSLIDDVGLIVLDEGHMIGPSEREIRYETLVQRLLRRSDAAECACRRRS